MATTYDPTTQVGSLGVVHWKRRELAEGIYARALDAIRSARRKGHPPGASLFSQGIRAMHDKMRDGGSELTSEAYNSVLELVRFHALDRNAAHAWPR